MAKLLEKPEEIRVTANTSGVPLTLCRHGTGEEVTAIYEQWKVADQWWGKDIERCYFRVKTSRGLVCDIYHETGTNSWYLSRIHD
ncbi:MAG: hypothetical protein DRI39_09685 [Chloroflexi bacterium]|nr:MAG: hypothetical protein DRI39_09685 [Chloroflexota bacterium]